MVLKYLIRYLFNDQVINKLADSYPIRRSAKWVVYFLHKAKAIKKDDSNLNVEKLKIIQRVSQQFLNFVYKIKAFQLTKYKSVKEDNQSTRKTDVTNRTNADQQAANKRFSLSQEDAEDKLKKYVEELQRRLKKD